MVVRLVARGVRGIETVLAEEIRSRGLGTVDELRHREVCFRYAGGSPLDLRCADDVFLVGAVVQGIGRGRSSLERIRAAAATVPVGELQMLREKLGGPAQPKSLDVSASFLGRRNFNRYDLEDAVGGALAEGIPYHSRRSGSAAPAGGMSWRLTLEGERAFLGLRIGAAPLHRRSYRQVTRPGSLHPPLAAAMVRLGRLRAGERLVDPCCGAGTILIEAGSGLGLDHGRTAIEAAAVNGPHLSWLRADAGSLPLASASVDVVVTNPPWDLQVATTGRLAEDPRRFWSELRRVLRPGGRAVLLLPSGSQPGLTPYQRYPVSVAGKHTEIILLRRTTSAAG